ncbi:MAG: hypothetical protein L6R42_001282 [Xanthoria sp. 1 TBL-2021]|nr:MAG: hypothetical protein L6R42_001282 [Xanthoria sp. 1 TBL-2021]
MSGSMRSTPHSDVHELDGISDQQQSKISKFLSFFSSRDHLRHEPVWRLKISIHEALLYQPALHAARKEVFPATSAKEKDKYLDYIPIMWVFANNLGQSSAYRSTPEFLLDMKVLSAYVFLADEYMESTVAQFSTLEFKAFKHAIENMNDHPSCRGAGSRNNDQSSASIEMPEVQGTNSSSNNTDRTANAFTIINSFFTYILTYPRISPASPTDRLELRAQTRNYLLHHIHQLEDNARLAAQPAPFPRLTNTTTAPSLSTSDEIPLFSTPRTSFPTWLHTTGAGHVSGPWSFSFFLCCISSTIRRGADCFTTLRQKLLAADMNAHIGAFCRAYNDYGSITRDRAENNLNSVNFPEFHRPLCSSIQAIPSEETDKPAEGRDEEMQGIKARLLEAAELERELALAGAERLYAELEKEEGEAGKRVVECLRVYFGACEQFSDMAVTKDVTNSVQ